MIITVTLNPAVDKTIKVPDFELGTLNRVAEVREDPGGKGINVSRAVVNLGGDTLALGFLAGPSGKTITSSLENLGINHDFTWLSGTTRTNIKAVDPKTGEETEINEPGPKMKDSKLDKLINNLLTKAETEDYVVLTGSLPPGVPEDIYKDIITKLKSREIKAVLDTSGLPLEKGLEADPYLIKPNRIELENLVGTEFEDLDQLITAGRKIQKQGVEVVLVSLGSEGAVLITEQGVWKTVPPEVEAESTIGAGDTMLAALTVQLSRSQGFPEALAYATAASVGTVVKPGTQLCSSEDIDKFLPKVELTSLERGEE